MPSSLTTPTTLSSDPYFARLKQHVIGVTGLAYYAHKDEELTTHLTRRLEASGTADCGEYLTLLHGDGGETELDVLITDLTIGETSFFRHSEQFDALRQVVLPDLIDRNRSQRRLRIWSAGCATGAEPYSLAILLKRELGKLLADWDVTILGTDINRHFLAQAQRGEFVDWAFRSAPEDLRSSCFERSGNQWVINPEYRQAVSFQYHNLVQHPFPSLVNNLFGFDLILCRNVMIYFSAEIMCRVISQFHGCLTDGGWLAVGHAESNVDYFRQFRTVNADGAVLYQRSTQPTVPPTWAPPTQVVRNTPAPNPTVAAGRMTCELPASPRTKELPQANTARNNEAAREPVSSGSLTLADIRDQADRGAWDEADRSCRHLLATERLNPLAHFYHALVLEQLGLHSQTEQALRQAIYLDRKLVLAHYSLGMLLQRSHDVPGAQRCFKSVLRLLEALNDEHVFDGADGLTVGDMKQLTCMHLEVLTEFKSNE